MYVHNLFILVTGSVPLVLCVCLCFWFAALSVPSCWSQCVTSCSSFTEAASRSCSVSRYSSCQSSCGASCPPAQPETHTPPVASKPCCWAFTTWWGVFMCAQTLTFWVWHVLTAGLYLSVEESCCYQASNVSSVVILDPFASGCNEAGDLATQPCLGSASCVSSDCYITFLPLHRQQQEILVRNSGTKTQWLCKYTKWMSRFLKRL